jgi:hypothetical protein
MDWLGLGGVFGGTLGGGLTAGAQQQQAAQANGQAAQYEVRMFWQTGLACDPAMLQNAYRASEEQQAYWDRERVTRQHVEEVRAAHGPDWTFWYWWVGLSVAAQICRLLHLAA